LSGRYTNQAIQSTESLNTSSRVPTRGFLASLLENGSFNYFDTNQLQISEVYLNVNLNRFEIFYRPESIGSSRAIRPGWRCDGMGGYVLGFSEEVDSEGAVGNVATTNIVLRLGRDGSLIAHLSVETKAIFPVGVGRREIWAMFRRVD
jgi:hypothetical protein